MITESVKIHDKFSIEIKLGYTSDEEIKKPEFNTDIYLFVPESLDINRYTYTGKNFYRDLKSNTRLMTPVFILRDIYKGENSPLKRLEKSFYNLARNPDKENIKQYQFQIKMYGSILKSALRREVFHIRENKLESDINYLLQSYIDNVRNINNEYRKLRRIINVPTIDAKLMDIYLFGDEYIGNVTQKYTFRLLRFLRSKNYDLKYKEELFKLINDETEYKISKNLPVVSENSDDNEELLYRRSVLKKFIESALFLNTKKRKDGELMEQILYSIAAGIAMVFATGVAFIAQKTYGNFTSTLFIALVISYMFKDRIKELTRAYFSGKYRKKHFDHKTEIFSSENYKVGQFKESFSYIEEKDIPERVLKRRNRSHLTEIENDWLGEKVILFRKRIKLYPKKLKNLYQDYPINGINGIARLNLIHFTEKMDNPETPMYLLENGSYKKIYGSKVYHINMIINFKTGNTVFFRRYRIVLNRNGIKRVQQIMIEPKN